MTSSVGESRAIRHAGMACRTPRTVYKAGCPYIHVYIYICMYIYIHITEPHYEVADSMLFRHSACQASAFRLAATNYAGVHFMASDCLIGRDGQGDKMKWGNWGEGERKAGDA